MICYVVIDTSVLVSELKASIEMADAFFLIKNKPAKSDSNLQEAAVAVWHLSLDEKIRQMCEAREDYYRRTAGREALLRKTTLERDQAVAELDRLQHLLEKHGINVNEEDT